MISKETANQFVATIKKYDHLLITIKGSPDPDALAAAFVVKLICEHHEVQASIMSPVQPSLPQNSLIIKQLDLPVKFKSLNNGLKHFDGYVVVDHQSVFVEDVTGIIPCALHLDHHKKSQENIAVDFRLIREDMGSTSTMLIFLLEELDIHFDNTLWARACTALYYGIQTDTDNFQSAEKSDIKALNMIAPYADKILLNRVYSQPFPKEALELLHHALENQVFYKDWLLVGLGFLNAGLRDNIAIIGDFLLKQEDLSAVVVFGIIITPRGYTLDASFRTRDENLNLNRLIKSLTKEGGARRFKGAFQVNLDYFVHCPEKKMLWEMVYQTTLQALKKKIDETYMGGIIHFYNRLKKKISSWIN